MEQIPSEERVKECSRLFDIRSAEVDFKATDGRPPLPIIAKLKADKATTWARIGSREGERSVDSVEECQVVGGASPATATVDADIEPDPIGHDRGRGRRRRHCPGPGGDREICRDR